MRGRMVAMCASLVGAQAGAASAVAAPAADVVILWTSAPAPPIATAVSEAARRAGAALIDVSPTAAAVVGAGPWVRKGIDGYGALEFDGALAALDAAADLVDRTGAAGLDATGLGDLFLYRGMVRAQRGDDARAWDDFVVAAAIDPTRVLDPARFSPRAVDQHGRARAEVAARGRGRIAITPGGCDVRIDGSPVAAETADVAIGRHWLHADCPDRAPAGLRIDVDRAELGVDVAGPAIDPPTDDEVLIQGRSAGARAVVVVTVRGGVATARRLGVDGREQDRAAVSAASPGAVGDAVAALLAPPRVVAPPRWYQSRWAWAIAGAVVASAILIPIAARGGDPQVDVRPANVPPW